MYDFDGFIRREMAIQANAENCGKLFRELHAEKSKAQPDGNKVAALKREIGALYQQKSLIYRGNVETQRKVVAQW